VSGSVWRQAAPARHDRHVGSFSGVITTSIYCRPGCGARPNSANRRAFPLAAAAEAAGFRACLRCRPYRTHPAVSHQTAPEVVCRAVRLIVDGILDNAAEDELGAQLGISARHLRRLFVEHLGLTPDQLARSTRVHFARRLLDDTDMHIADIAYAAGFGSLRQFNRACQDTFHAAPGELRARRRVHDRLIADGGIALRLPFQPPFDWDAMLGYMQSHSIAGVEHVSPGSYRRTVVIGGDPGVLDLSLGGPDHLVLHAHLPHWAGLIHIAQRARGIFNLDADTETAARDLGADPLAGHLFRSQPGIRPPGTWDPFETGVQALAGEQASLADTTKIMWRIVERYGTPVPGLRAFGLTHTFPPPPALASADLHGLGLGTSQISAIHAFARAVTTHAVTFSRGIPLDALARSITAIRGVSDEVAQHLALRLGERDAFPCSPQLLRILSHVTGQAVAPQQAQCLGDRWRPWRAHVTAQLLLNGQASPGNDAPSCNASPQQWTHQNAGRG
jgi:AraC family transcriptional regulator, regulatory protein of adaptative response / DNA-3-methyladenine glycosylase II